MKSHLIVDRFYDGATELRKVFEDRFNDGRSTSSERFVWDHWYVRDQYRLIRTPAFHYFPAKMYRRFHESLVNWGREVLGCHDISPPWLSYYVDGCRQNLHSDVPHGPWAYVYSLSPKRVLYRGGETLILKPQTLRFWQSFAGDEDREVERYVEKIPSPFNRLTVFDPRLPHGVSEVRGVEDPCEARLVIHGWFVEPRPYVVGALTTAQVQKVIGRALEQLSVGLESAGALHGTLSLRLKVSPSGQVSELKVLTDTMVGLEDDAAQRKWLLRSLRGLFLGSTFPSRPSGSQITIPLLFRT